MFRSAHLSKLCFALSAALAACSSSSPRETVGAAGAAVRTSAPTCALASATGALKHVVYVQFDNVHFTRDDSNVPSDLEQMPHLLSFLEGQGTLLSNHHTPLISHTANDITTALTGLYPDRQGLAVANSYRYFTSAGTSKSASDFTYWTDPVSATDTSFNLLGPDGKNTPAPWATYTRAGCDFGAVSIVDMELENVAGDVTTVFGAGSPQAAEAASNPTKAAADLEGIAIHCAAGSALCSNRDARADELPDEPGGYGGFQALFGHAAVAPHVSSGPIQDLDGNVITDAAGNVGFPGFNGMTATRTLGYVATMLEAGVPIVYSYISDADDAHSDTGGAFGPGSAGYVAQLASYDAAFAKFFARLAQDGIDGSNTLFVFTADEGDHFVGGVPSPASCDGVTVPCNYAQIGEINANVTGLLAAQGVTTPFSIAQSLGVYVDGNPGAADPSTRTLERAFGALEATNPDTSAPENVSRFIADRTEMGLLHMVTGDPARTPTFTTFVNPNWYIYAGAPTCTTSAPCVQQEAAYAWNHGMVSEDVNHTWLGIVGPGVREQGVTAEVWSDHSDVRPTILALAGLKDDYTHEGRALFEILHDRAVPGALREGGPDVERLARVFKQINAPVGRLGMTSLYVADMAAKSGDASSDAEFTRVSAALGAITTRRDALAAKIEAALDGATFGGKPIAPAEARRLAHEGERLLMEMASLAATL